MSDRAPLDMLAVTGMLSGHHDMGASVAPVPTVRLPVGPGVTKDDHFPYVVVIFPGLTRPATLSTAGRRRCRLLRTYVNNLKYDVMLRRLRQAGASDPVLRPGDHAKGDAKVHKEGIGDAVVQEKDVPIRCAAHARR
jgi:hypothetical protein